MATPAKLRPRKATIPAPGRVARGSRTGRPIMALLDLLGRRWALRILWEFHEGPRTFTELQARCDAMSPSVLHARLRELTESGVITAHPAGGYGVTTEGKELCRALVPLGAWAGRWARRGRTS